MQKIGIMLDTFYSNEKTYYAIRNINNFLKNNNGYDIVIFVKNLTIPCIQPDCSIMKWHELWCYNGDLVATDIESLNRAIGLPGPKSIIHYIYDLEWMNKEILYEDYAALYQNKNIKMISRNKNHSKVISNVWNVDVPQICEDFNMNKMVEIINDDN